MCSEIWSSSRSSMNNIRCRMFLEMHQSTGLTEVLCRHWRKVICCRSWKDLVANLPSKSAGLDVSLGQERVLCMLHLANLLASPCISTNLQWEQMIKASALPRRSNIKKTKNFFALDSMVDQLDRTPQQSRPGKDCQRPQSKKTALSKSVSVVLCDAVVCIGIVVCCSMLGRSCLANLLHPKLETEQRCLGSGKCCKKEPKKKLNKSER